MSGKEKIGIVAALKSYFGLKEGQKLQDFVAELKALSPEEKLELARDCADSLGKELEVKA